ncbi:eIF2 kinase Gcn2p negative regulator [Mycoblastus sanguinarius]|nr:eIF2 kinase Gcn2p negative regulator [Mycoblastus sanguinarius]
MEKKSIFLARVCAVTSPAQAKACVAHLLATDKRAARATHNITAYCIRSLPTADSVKEIIHQDCDDDGETAAGGRLLHLLQVMDVWGLLVVVSRWYGGVKLGPDRFRIINTVAREAIVDGGWLREEKR